MRRLRWAWAAIAATAVLAGACGGDDGTDGTATRFRMGYAEVDITPPEGTVLGGYGVPGMDRVSRGPGHDPLMAQAALFVNDAGGAFLVIAADLAGYLWDFGDWGPGVKALRQAIADALAPTLPIAPEHVLVTSSHSHGATDLAGFSQPIGEGPPPALLDDHLRKLTEVAVAAAGSLRDVRLHFGEAVLSGVALRDEDCSPVLDERVAILQARDDDGRVLLTMANFALHPTIAGERNRATTADFVWGYRDRMRQATGAPAMYLQGFEAAVHARDSFLDGPDMWDVVHATGAALADAVLGRQDALVPADSFDIRHRAALYPIQATESFMVDIYTALDMPKRYIDVIDGVPTVREAEVSWHLLGPAEFAVFPGEPSPEYAVLLKDRMVSPWRFAVGLGNDGLGYLVEPQSVENDTTGRLAGYEVKMGLGPLAGPATWAAMAGLGWFDGAWRDAD